jgi:hypothetical protein
MAFDVKTNKLLSEDVADLVADDEAAFTAQQELAIDLLGLRGKDATLSTDAKAKAERFLALQINYQLETGVDAAIYAMKVRGSRTVSYKSASADLVRPGLLDEVQELIDTDDGDSGWGDRGYAVITSFR